MSDRIKRAEDIIRTCLRTAPIYLAGTQLDIKQKDGKDRMQDALKEMVKRDYFKLSLVCTFYNDQKSIFSMLNDTNTSMLRSQMPTKVLMMKSLRKYVMIRV